MGCYLYVALAGEDKIAVFGQDPDTGELSFREDLPLGGAPGPLAVDPAHKFMYAGLRSTCELVSLRIDSATGSLTPIGAVDLESDPCYLSTDKTGRYVLGAYYRAGRVAVHEVGQDGAACTPAIEWLATAEKAHCIQTDASNRVVRVSHTGPNIIFQYLFDERTGRLAPAAVPSFLPDAGVGPRHYCYHPTRDWVYVVNEQGGSVTAYRLHPAVGLLKAFQPVSTLPEGFEGKNTCAQIHVHPSGRFLYASNRGHDSIACFTIDGDTGEITSLGQRPTEQRPRVFDLDPTGRFLYVGGGATGAVASYRVNQETGRLTALERYQVGTRPMWVMVLDLAD